jgi:very-short-patch-repair endonuclease
MFARVTFASSRYVTVWVCLIWKKKKARSAIALCGMPIIKKVLKSIRRCGKLKRKKPIRPKGKFRAHGANALKTYRRRRTDAEVRAYANQCRRDRLRNRTKEEVRLCEILDDQRILYEVEKVFLNGDRHILADFFISSAMLVIEVDGSSHDFRKKYYAGRDRWLLDQYGVRTLRLPNETIFRKPRDALDSILLAIGAAH